VHILVHCNIMAHKLEITRDKAFRKEIALNRLSSTLQQANIETCKNVIHDVLTSEHTIKKTLKKSTDLFIQNLDKISKKDIKDEKVS